MTEKKCEFGCECDIMEFGEFSTVLEPTDFDRLVAEKTARARRYIELQKEIVRTFTTD